jgi:hypothetical protein
MKCANPRPRDSQRSKLYRWEEATLNPRSPRLSRPECMELAETVCTDYGVALPLVNFTGKRLTYTTGSPLMGTGPTICLPEYGRHRCGVLHELAHHLLHQRFNNTVAWHGPEFVRVYLDLIEWYAPKDFKIAELRKSLADAGIKISWRPVDFPRISPTEKALIQKVRDAEFAFYDARRQLREYRKDSTRVSPARS